MASRPIKVSVFCATALATSTLAAMKLQEALKKRDIICKTTTGRISDLASNVRLTHPDVVVATAVTKMDVGQPIFNGIPLLTGIGVDELVDEIVDYLKKENLL
ncbi:MAG: hypothetical protein IJ115_06495 [Erysipelotrichaceae bacterium]|nr:hypothetical protein [Erysipelotrichaceae bacterium]